MVVGAILFMIPIAVSELLDLGSRIDQIEATSPCRRSDEFPVILHLSQGVLHRLLNRLQGAFDAFAQFGLVVVHRVRIDQRRLEV